MSERESRNKPLTLLQVGGVNQRVRATELPPTDYPNIEGVFPEFAGLQSRIWGKRLHKLYEEAVYGIHQFWTPMGYGGGIYQFEETVDFGQWLTPTSDFDLTIPPLLLDGGGMTLDEFGLGFGSNFGWGTDNVCLISFLNGSTDHSACLSEMENVGTPDDSNGSPAGQGKHCAWDETSADYPIENFVQTKQQATGSYNTVNIIDNVGNTLLGCVPYPTEPPDLGADAAFGAYSSIATTGSLASTQSVSASHAYVNNPTNPLCAFKVTETLTGNATNQTAVLNFAALQNQNVQLITLLAVRPSGSIEIPFISNPEDIANDIGINMLDYRQTGTVTHGGFGTSFRTDSVSVTNVRVYMRERICS